MGWIGGRDMGEMGGKGKGRVVGKPEGVVMFQRGASGAGVVHGKGTPSVQ